MCVCVYVCACVFFLFFYIFSLCTLIFIDEKISYTRRKDDPQRKFSPRLQGLELAILCIGGRCVGPLLLTWQARSSVYRDILELCQNWLRQYRIAATTGRSNSGLTPAGLLVCHKTDEVLFSGNS